MKEEFEEMLKINEAFSLSNIIRAYLYKITGLFVITQIINPMVNLVEL